MLCSFAPLPHTAQSTFDISRVDELQRLQEAEPTTPLPNLLTWQQQLAASDPHAPPMSAATAYEVAVNRLLVHRGLYGSWWAVEPPGHGPPLIHYQSMPEEAHLGGSQFFTVSEGTALLRADSLQLAHQRAVQLAIAGQVAAGNMKRGWRRVVVVPVGEAGLWVKNAAPSAFCCQMQENCNRCSCPCDRFSMVLQTTGILAMRE